MERGARRQAGRNAAEGDFYQKLSREHDRVGPSARVQAGRPHHKLPGRYTDLRNALERVATQLTMLLRAATVREWKDRSLTLAARGDMIH